ncbi:MAG: NYN domain-containing protein [Gammaproteobacteria bacterium]|nr:NYN domain-containing protein [Gammaproteobacteria bacterium]
MIKVAILIDGGYFLKRLPAVRADVDPKNPTDVARSIWQLVRSHLDQFKAVWKVADANQLLYRTFFYDARPYGRKAHRPVSGEGVDFARTEQARFRDSLIDALRSSRNVAVRLGEVRKEVDRSWVLRTDAQKALLTGQRAVADLTDEDFTLAVRQKGVDMRIGLDIASLALKRQVDAIVLVAGDSDFVPAAKLARREGVRFVLDPLWQNIPTDLNEHIDGLTSGFPRPSARRGNDPDSRFHG